MSEYDTSMDEHMEKLYIKIAETLDDIKHPYGAYQTFWMWIAELLTDCFNPDRDIVGINDNMGMMMSKIKGNNLDCNEILFKVERDIQGYERYLKEFGISKNLDESGNYYKEIHEENDELTIKQMIEVFSDYANVIAPFVYEETATWLSEERNDVFDEAKMIKVKKSYKNYISKYKGMIKVFKG